MEPKPFCLHRAEGANNQVKQRDAFVFTRNPISVTYNQLSAMLTILFHIFPLLKESAATKKNIPYQIDLLNVQIFFSEFYEWREFYKFFVTNYL
jgi:hypothetical protein